MAHLCVYGACLALAISAGACGSAMAADPAADFYRGKTITLIVGTAEGGGYDLSARLVSQHLGRFIPGNPSIIARNMGGASSVVAAQYLYNVAPKDGTVLGMLQPTVVSEKLLDRSPKYEPQDFTWIGRVDSSLLVGAVWHTSPVQSIADAKQREVSLAAQGASGTAATVPWALNRMLGTKFKVVLGYPSSGLRGLAMERGEVQGLGSASIEYIQSQETWLQQKLITFLYAVDVTRSRYLPEVPALPELGESEQHKRVLFLLGSTSAIGRALLSTPALAPERAATLRRAFDQLVQDPAFLADAKKRGLGVDPLAGPPLAKLVADTMSQPEEAVTELRALSQPPK